MIKNILSSKTKREAHSLNRLTKGILPSVAISSLLLFSGCGGGGGSSGGGATTGNQTGYIVDSGIEGLNYKTSSGIEGVTTEGGKYKYNEGDTVVFKLSLMLIFNVILFFIRVSQCYLIFRLGTIFA